MTRVWRENQLSMIIFKREIICLHSCSHSNHVLGILEKRLFQLVGLQHLFFFIRMEKGLQWGLVRFGEYWPRSFQRLNFDQPDFPRPHTKSRLFVWCPCTLCSDRVYRVPHFALKYSALLDLYLVPKKKDWSLEHCMQKMISPRYAYILTHLQEPSDPLLILPVITLSINLLLLLWCENAKTWIVCDILKDSTCQFWGKHQTASKPSMSSYM